MKPFPSVAGGGSALNVSLHLILLSLALIAGFYLIFRELRRVEFDLHDAIQRNAATTMNTISTISTILRPASPSFRFDGGVVLAPPVAAISANIVDAPALLTPTPTPTPTHAPEVVDALPAVQEEEDDDAEGGGDPTDDDMSSLSEDQLTAKPASALRDFLKRRDLSAAGNKHELAKRILAAAAEKK